MKADHIKRLLDRGFSVVITDTKVKVSERYTLSETGMYVREYLGAGLCPSCGKPHAFAGVSGCRCNEELRTSSMTDTYRRLLGVNGLVSIHKKAKLVHVLDYSFN